MNQFMNIPVELKHLPQWVCHRNKVPFNPVTGVPAKAGQPATWASFEDCVNALDGGGYDGIGFEFNNNGIVGIDLAHFSRRAKELFPNRNIVVEYGEEIMGECGLTITMYQM